MYRFVKVNKARCLHCNDIVISHPDQAGQIVTCSCGTLRMSGGSTSLIRNGVQDKDFEELSELNFEGECPFVNEETQEPPPEQDQMIDALRKKYKR